MKRTGRGALRVLAPMALCLVGAVAVTAHLVQVVQPSATGVRVASDVEAPAAGATELGPIVEPPKGFPGPALPPGSKPRDAAAVRPWFTHGRWWAAFAVPGDGYHLFAWTGSQGPWLDTNVLVDDRPDVTIDVAVDGDHLVVVASGARSYRRDAVRVRRFTWDHDLGGWHLDPDFPVELSDTGIVGGVQVAVTDDGQIWLGRLDNGRVLLAHLGATGTPVAPFAPLADEVAGTDVGAYTLVADRDVLRVVWRSATRDLVSMASGDGSSWSVTDHELWGAAGSAPLDAAPAGPDHPGTILVLVPTPLARRTTNDRAPSLVLVEMGSSGTREAVVAVREDHLSHPSLVVAPEQGRVSVVAAVAPPSTEAGEGKGSWTVTEKRSPIARPVFPPGSGHALMSSPNLASWSLVAGSVRGPAFGLVVAVIDPHRRSWVTVQQDGGPPEKTIALSSSSVLHDSFDAATPGDPGPPAWFRQEAGPRSTTVIADGDGRSLAVSADPDAERTTVCRALPAWGGDTVTIRAELRSFGVGSADARLLTIRGPKGPLVAIRRSSKAMVGHLTAGGRVDDLVLPEGSALVVTVRIQPDAPEADVRLEVADTGETKAATVPYLTAFAVGPARVCVSPAPGTSSAHVEVADLDVTRG